MQNSQNPLFPANQTSDPSTTSPGVISDASGDPAAYTDASRSAAAELIRQKVAAAYGDEAIEPPVDTPAPIHANKHTAYLEQLKQSGKSLVEVQSAWHSYYSSLDDAAKHEVWGEFNNSQQQASPVVQELNKREPVVVTPTPSTPLSPASPIGQPVAAPASAQPFYNPVPPAPVMSQQVPPQGIIPQQPVQQPYQQESVPIQPQVQPAIIPSWQSPVNAQVVSQPQDSVASASNAAPLTSGDINRQALQSARDQDSPRPSGKLKSKHHLQSLAFGLASGLVVCFIFVFSFFNEVFLAPFIQPSRTVSKTPIIVDPASAAVGDQPKVIIPKINVEIPTDYSQTSTDNKTIEAALDNGIVHYPTTAKPGQPGNAAFFGHSSNNIFNPGKYKFAFVLLHELREGDTFYLTNEGQAYAYKVIGRKVVEPTEISVLDPIAEKSHIATLITCDPPGTSLKRLVVFGEQISPAPSGEPAPIPSGDPATPPVLSASSQNNLPGNGPTLWSRFWSSIF